MTTQFFGGRFDSPSLTTVDQAVPAFEMKFLVNESVARAVEASCRHQLSLDPHGDATLGGGYRTTTLYTDTPTLDVYARMPKYRSCKYRVRRYGNAEWFFVERKFRRGDRVAKRRSRIEADDLQLLAAREVSDSWSAQWFREILLSRQLGPACQIGYERLAFAGESQEGPLRLTFDRNIRGTWISNWEVVPFGVGPLLLEEQVILELKFRTSMPAPFKRLVQEFALFPTAVSKYRLCREAAAKTMQFSRLDSAPIST